VILHRLGSLEKDLRGGFFLAPLRLFEKGNSTSQRKETTQAYTFGTSSLEAHQGYETGDQLSDVLGKGRSSG